MAKKHSGLDVYQKYRDNSKKTDAFLKSVDQAGKKAQSNLKKISRKKEAERNRRIAAYKREVEKANVAKAKERETKPSEPFTFEDFKYLFIVVAFIVIAVTVSFWVALAVALVVFVIGIVIEVNKESKKEGISQAEIAELQRHLAEIEVNKGIANNSEDPFAVKNAMDELLKSIDFIMTYEEEVLHHAGMSKELLPAQRAFIVQHYDVMIQQAQERSIEDNE